MRGGSHHICSSMRTQTDVTFNIHNCTKVWAILFLSIFGITDSAQTIVCIPTFVFEKRTQNFRKETTFHNLSYLYLFYFFLNIKAFGWYCKLLYICFMSVVYGFINQSQAAVFSLQLPAARPMPGNCQLKAWTCPSPPVLIPHDPGCLGKQNRHNSHFWHN